MALPRLGLEEGAAHDVLGDAGENPGRHGDEHVQDETSVGGGGERPLGDILYDASVGDPVAVVSPATVPEHTQNLGRPV